MHVQCLGPGFGFSPGQAALCASLPAPLDAAGGLGSGGGQRVAPQRWLVVLPLEQPSDRQGAVALDQRLRQNLAAGTDAASRWPLLEIIVARES